VITRVIDASHASRRTFGEVQPLATDLAERVGTALCRQARVVGLSSRPRVDLRPERRDHVLAVLRIELALGSNHAIETDDCGESPTRVTFLFVASRPRGVDAIPPPVERNAQVSMRKRLRGVDEHFLFLRERLRRSVTRPDERLHGRSGDLALAERIRDARHLDQRPRDLNLRGGDALGDAVAMREPRSGRQLPIGGVHASTFDLDQTSRALGFDHTRRAFELVHAHTELGVGQRSQLIRSKFVQHRPQRAHRCKSFERMFATLQWGSDTRSRRDRLCRDEDGILNDSYGCGVRIGRERPPGFDARLHDRCRDQHIRAGGEIATGSF
jgi:hypothetical protein